MWSKNVFDPFFELSIKNIDLQNNTALPSSAKEIDNMLKKSIYLYVRKEYIYFCTG